MSLPSLGVVSCPTVAGARRSTASVRLRLAQGRRDRACRLCGCGYRHRDGAPDQRRQSRRRGSQATLGGTARGWSRTGTDSGRRKRNGCGWSTRRASARLGGRAAVARVRKLIFGSTAVSASATGSDWCTSGVRRRPGSPGSDRGPVAPGRAGARGRATRPDPGGAVGHGTSAGLGAGMAYLRVTTGYWSRPTGAAVGDHLDRRHHDRRDARIEDFQFTGTTGWRCCRRPRGSTSARSAR